MSNPISAFTRFRKPRLLRWIVLIGVLLFAISVLWFCVRTTYFGSDIFMSFSLDAKPGTVAFVVHDQHGTPLAGIPVDSQSHSGNAGEVVTDGSGHAAIIPAESEVLTVFVDRRMFRLRPGHLIETFFAPTCFPSGLTFDVTIRK